MGIQVDREEFEEAEYVRFAERLEACLTALRALLQRPSFGVGEPTVGAELELFLVDRQGLPLAENAAVLQQAADPRVTLEVDRFNLELNPHPSSLAGRPFSSLGAQMAEVAAAVRRAAGAHGGRVAMVGILPTLRAADLHRGAITDSARYRALDKGLRRLRQEPIRVRIQGADPEPVELVRDDVALEGANTSFQVHLRVDPDRFGAAWNAAAGATAPVLAVAGNSPTFLGRRLWEETRVALFEQAADDRDERGRDRLVPRVAFGTRWASGDACALFEEAVRLHQPLLPLLSQEDPLRAVEDGGVPHLDELRLHQGTVWRWNRPVYDASAGGHLRLELRALPAGPTVTDMLANAAFLLGVTLAVTPRVGGWLAAFPFARAHANFYAAARFGLGAELHWPAPDGQGLRPVGAAELARRLLPEAGEALEAAGVDGGEAGRLLAVVQERLAAGQTGSVWQRRSLDALQPRLGRDRALHELLERYLELSASDQPVHTWPLAGGPQVASTPGRAWPQAAPAPPAPNSRWRTLGSPALPRSAASRVQGCCGVVVGWDRRRRLRPGLPEATLRPRRPGPGQAPRHRGSASPRGESGSTELPPARPVGSRCTGAWQPALRVPEVPAHAAAGHGCHGGHHADHGGTQRSQLTQEKHEEVVRRLTSGKSRFGSRSDVPFEGLLLHVVGRGKNGFPRCRPAAAGCCVDRRS